MICNLNKTFLVYINIYIHVKPFYFIKIPHLPLDYSVEKETVVLNDLQEMNSHQIVTTKFIRL